MEAFCTAIGQPRTLFLISSGAKSRRVSQVPASRPITLMPARVSGRAATPPAAPIPTITTSVSGSLVGMVTSMRMAAGRRLVETLEVVRGLVIGLELSFLHRLLVRGRDAGAYTGIANQVPADEVRVAAVVRIAERSLTCVTQHHREELCRAAGEVRAGRAGGRAG